MRHQFLLTLIVVALPLAVSGCDGSVASTSSTTTADPTAPDTGDGVGSGGDTGDGTTPPADDGGGACQPSTCVEQGLACGSFVDPCTGETLSCPACTGADICYEGACVAAVLRWRPPMTDAEGATLSDLAGYRVYWGAS